MSGLGEKISKPISQAGASYDVIVIGSGYGGGVTASRLARAGRKVAVLERGREIRPGEYPDTAATAMADTRITTARSDKLLGRADGLYDLRLYGDMNVFLGCGVGGTSLVNANVALEIDHRIFAEAHWPQVFQKNPKLLDAYYDRARHMLGSTPYPEKLGTLPKLEALKKSAEALDAPFSRPPINVTFQDGPNAAGIQQKACTLCGDCCSGCNYGAKNTVLMNYLPDAVKHGAEIFTGATALWLEKADGRWTVAIANTGAKDMAAPSIHISAEVVILAAGTLGSTEIMLRSREKGLAVSDALGKHFSGNGDVLAFGYNANQSQSTSKDVSRPPVFGIGAGYHKPDKPAFKPGPCITGLIDMRDPRKPVSDGLVIEEGVMPGALAMAYTPLFFMADALGSSITRFGDTELRLTDAQKLGELIQDDPGKLAQAAYDGPLSRTQSFLVMSHDDAGGEIRLDGNRAVVRWPDAGREASIARDNDILSQASDGIWAEFLTNPLWQNKFGRKLITVHPVGGCSMADDASQGVVNDRCQVFSSNEGNAVHDGLYICDGSVMPGAVGVNPLLTISAVSERAMELLAEEHGWDIDWSDNPPEPKAGETADKGKKHESLFKRFGQEIKSKLSHELDNLVDEVKGVAPGVIISLAIAQLQELVEDINKKQFEEAKERINFMRNALIAMIGKPAESLPDAKELLTDFGSAIHGQDGVLTNTIGPIIEEFLPILKDIQTPLENKDYGAIFSLLEREMGDFSPGLSFSERMAGRLSTHGLDRPHPISDPYTIAGADSSDPALDAVARFTIDAQHLGQLLKDPKHTAQLSGSLFYPFLGGELRLADDSHFQLLPENMTRVECWNMIYSGKLLPAPGDAPPRPLFFKGVKTLKRRYDSNWWSDLTTLAVDIHDGVDETAPVLVRGLLRLDMQDLAIQGSTVNTGFDGTIQNLAAQIKEALIGPILLGTAAKALEAHKLRAKIVQVLILLAASSGYPQIEKLADQLFLSRFAALFAQLIFRTYGGPFAYLNNFPASDDAARRERWKENGPPKRKIPAPTPVPATPPSAREPVDGHPFALTRYQGGDKGPVILAPGFGTTAASFAMETTEINLVEYLAHNGYDVWLLDYRGSPALNSSRKDFSIDDVAHEDWPAAVEEVLNKTGASAVQCIAHCVGSMSLLMAVLAGMKGVKSIISSQTSVHPVTSWFNAVKADSGLASVLHSGAPKSMDGLIDALGLNPELAEMLKNGIATVDMVSSDAVRDKAIDLLLWNVPFPGEPPCYSPTCHRVFGVFGASYVHDQLNEMTHNALVDVFGEVSSTPFLQLAEIMRAGVVSNDYMKHPERLCMPIDFIAGSRNQIFYPETTLRTYNWLEAKNPSRPHGNYTRRVFTNYAHMDCFIGRSAATDIFPYLLERLQARA